MRLLFEKDSSYQTDLQRNIKDAQISAVKNANRLARNITVLDAIRHAVTYN